MRIVDNEFTDVQTPAGPMRTYLFRPRAEGRFPGVVVFTEIFQVTHQMRRAAAVLAGHGLLVALPEIFHEFLPCGRALPYSDDGRAEGRRLMGGKQWRAYDDDAAAVLKMLRAHGRCTGGLGVAGFCFGGHLALRAAANAEVRACAAFYPTALVAGRVDGAGRPDTLARLARVKAEIGVWVGSEDPLLPAADRQLILADLASAGVRYRWHEIPGGHGFMRDGGPDYDPELALSGYAEMISLLRRNLSP